MTKSEKRKFLLLSIVEAIDDRHGRMSKRELIHLVLSNDLTENDYWLLQAYADEVTKEEKCN